MTIHDGVSLFLDRTEYEALRLCVDVCEHNARLQQARADAPERYADGKLWPPLPPLRATDFPHIAAARRALGIPLPEEVSP